MTENEKSGNTQSARETLFKLATLWAEYHKTLLEVGVPEKLAELMVRDVHMMYSMIVLQSAMGVSTTFQYKID